MCSRPAVSTSTRSAPRLGGRGHRVEHDRAGIGALLAAHDARRRCARPRARAGRPPRRGTCRRRRARRVRPSATRCGASLPIVVVLPTPFTPTNIHTFGSPAAVRERRGVRRRRAARPPRRARARSSASASADPLGLGPRPAPRRGCVRRGRHADVGEEQRLFELVPRVVVDLRRLRPRRRAGERGAGLAEAVARARGRLDLGRDVRPRLSASTGGDVTRRRRSSVGARSGVGHGCGRTSPGMPRSVPARSARQDRADAPMQRRPASHDDEDDDELARGGTTRGGARWRVVNSVTGRSPSRGSLERSAQGPAAR